jgi:hypothetical protein
MNNWNHNKLKCILLNIVGTALLVASIILYFVLDHGQTGLRLGLLILAACVFYGTWLYSRKRFRNAEFIRQLPLDLMIFTIAVLIGQIVF